MTSQSKRTGIRFILRAPFFVLFLFLFYLLGKHAIGLVEAFSVALGFPPLAVKVASIVLLVFFGFIGALVVLNYFRDSGGDRSPET